MKNRKSPPISCGVRGLEGVCVGWMGEGRRSLGVGFWGWMRCEFGGKRGCNSEGYLILLSTNLTTTCGCMFTRDKFEETTLSYLESRRER